MVVLKVDLVVQWMVHLMLQRAPTDKESPIVHMYDVSKPLNNYIIRKVGHCPVASLQSLKEKKSKQSIDRLYR